MKRALSLLTVAAIALTLTACSKTGDAAGSREPSGSVVSTGGSCASGTMEESAMTTVTEGTATTVTAPVVSGTRQTTRPSASGEATGTSNTPGVQVNGTPFNSVFYNPVMSDDMLGDPYVYAHNGEYYYCLSTGTGLEIRKSKTLSGLAASEAEGKEVWNGRSNNLSMVWAPEIFFYGNRWYAYIAASDNNATVNGEVPSDKNLVHRMYVLRSKTSDALGGWELTGKLELPDDQWAIDGTFFEWNGGLYTIWSGWKDFSQGPGVWKQNLYICELESPEKVKPGATRVMICESTYAWEKNGLPQCEGPAMLKGKDGKLYCVYSASYSGGNNYCMGLLTLNGDPLSAGAWKKDSQPLMSGLPKQGIYSPGHCSFAPSPDGKETYMLYHAAKQKDAGWDRSARLQVVKFGEDGKPFMDPPLSTGKSQPLPSGEVVDRRLFEAEELTGSGTVIMNYEDANGGKVLKLNAASSFELKATVAKAGKYAVTVRYTNPTGNTQSLRAQVNGASTSFQFRLRKAGGSGQFAVVANTVPLNAGDNLLRFTGDVNCQIDYIIIEQI